ncbi:hypothetical protein GDO81_028675 [Engystomops pustulosus]|uniref:Uncharacterized protein n=1 Tax=Engystomops pustulosus TaxID=76066 RepID=A0AAV6YDI6_ENGPU|nr:hypothetical protein GDO81_028675 [Engystomops pustulosus]
MVSGSPNLQKNLTHQLLGCSSGSSLGHGRSFWPPWKEINAHRHVLLRTTFGSWIKSICSLWKGYSGLGVGSLPPYPGCGGHRLYRLSLV